MTTWRLFLLSLVTYLLVIAGLILLDGQVLALSLPFILYLSASLLSAPAEFRLEITRSLSAERAGPETPVEVTVRLTNTGPALEEILVEDHLPAGLIVYEGSARRLLRLPSGVTESWKYTVGGQRGYYPFTSFIVKAFHPFGLVSRQREIPAPGRLFILPPVSRLKNMAIRPRRTRVFSGIVPARTGGPGVEFFDIREYQAGDPPRWIYWRAAARHPSLLFSKEFEQERVADVGIILDGRQRANLVAPGHSLFEFSAAAAASLADEFLSKGNRVSLLIYGEYVQWTLPGYGKLQRERILRALARAQLGSSQIFSDLDHIPTRLFPARSQVVLISPLTPDDPEVVLKLRARGYRVLLVTPDPVSYEVSFLPRQASVELAERVLRMERDLMLQHLQRAGLQLVEWDVSQPFDRVMHQNFGRRQVWAPAFGGYR